MNNKRAKFIVMFHWFVFPHIERGFNGFDGSSFFGLPVITTKVPGCEDAVVDQHTGLIVPAKDSIALAKAIEKLLSNDELREKWVKIIER